MTNQEFTMLRRNRYSVLVSVVAITLALTSSVALAGLPSLPAEGEWPYGSAAAMEIRTNASGSLLFLGHGRVVQILDISDPENLQLLGEVTLGAVVRHLELSVDGDTLAASDSEATVSLVDVSNRTAPVVTGTFVDTEDGRIPGGMAFGPEPGLLTMTAGPIGLYILDIQDPADIHIEGTWVDVSGNFYLDVVLLGDFAFVAEGNNGLTAVDVSDPTAPVFSAHTGFASPVSLTLDGTRCYTAGNGDGMRIVDLDVSGPTATFTPRGSLDLGTLPAGYGVVKDVAVTSGNRVVLADSEFGNGLLVVNVTNPDNPTYVERFGGPVLSVAVWDDVAFGLSLNDIVTDPKLSVVDLDPGTNRTPQLLDTWDVWAEAVDVDVQGDEVVVSDSRSGLVLFDASDAANPVELGSFQLNNDVQAAVRVDDVVVAAVRDNLVEIVDFSNPGTPVLLSPYNFAGGSNIVDHLERIPLTSNVVIPAYFSGVHILSFADPMNPTELGVWPAPQDAIVRRVSVDGDVVAIYGFDDNQATFWLVDISNPAVPVDLGSFPYPHDVQDFHLYFDHLYVASGVDGVRIWDVEIPATAQEVAHIDLQVGSASGVRATGGLLYVTAGQLFGLLVYGIVDPADPVQLDWIPTPGSAEKVDGSLLLVALADGPAGARFWGLAQSSQIFVDGFEIGSTAAWSQ
jgi:hypothetical protein